MRSAPGFTLRVATTAGPVGSETVTPSASGGSHRAGCRMAGRGIESCLGTLERRCLGTEICTFGAGDCYNWQTRPLPELPTRTDDSANEGPRSSGPIRMVIPALSSTPDRLGR